MSHHLTSDDRGVIQSCPACGTANRVSYARLGRIGRCGSCRAELPRIADPVEISSPEAFAALRAQSPLPVLVDFWAPWCGPCRMMASEFAKAASLAAGEAVLVKVNTDEQPQIAAQFHMEGIPAFALLRHGHPVAQSSGARPAAELLSWMWRA